MQVFCKVIGQTLDEMSRGIGVVSSGQGAEDRCVGYVMHGGGAQTGGDAQVCLAYDVTVVCGRSKGLFETKTKAYSQATEGTMNRVKAANQSKPLQVRRPPDCFWSYVLKRALTFCLLLLLLLPHSSPRRWASSSRCCRCWSS